MPKKSIVKSSKRKVVKVLVQNAQEVFNDVKSSLKKPAYTATLKIMGKVYESSGANLTEIMHKFKVEGNVKTWGLLRVVRKGTDAQIELIREKIVPAPFIWKFFNGSRMMKEMALKNILIMFNL